MPTGKVKFFDVEKGFGFVSGDDGNDVYLPGSALPPGTTRLKPGTRIEYSLAQGRRGSQALNARILDTGISLAENARKSPGEMVIIVEDLIKLLDGMSSQLRRGRYPDSKHSTRIAEVLRAVADDLES